MTNPKQTTIAERFLAQARATPDRPALVFPDVTFSYGQLRSLIASFALRFHAEGLGHGRSLHLRVEDPAVSLPAILAASLLGVPVDALPSSDITQILVTTKQPNSPVPHVLVDESFSPSCFSHEEKETVWKQFAVEANVPWLQCLRSTEGDKHLCVPLSQSDVVDRALRSMDSFGDQVPEVAVLFPVMSYEGLTRRLATLFCGGSLYEATPWKILAESSVTHVMLPPSKVRALVAADGSTSVRKKCEVLGLRVSGTELDALLRQFTEVCVVLDLAETGPVCTSTTKNSGWKVETCQTITAQTDIVDLAGRSANLGRLRVKIGETSDEWIMPGIAARKTDVGLDLLGPAISQDTIFVGGKALDAELLDSVISSTDGILEAIAFASPKAGQDEILTFAIFEDGVNRHQVVRRVENACMNAFGLGGVPAKVRPILAIPRMADGRPDRSLCSEMIISAAQASAHQT